MELVKIFLNYFIIMIINLNNLINIRNENRRSVYSNLSSIGTVLLTEGLNKQTFNRVNNLDENTAPNEFISFVNNTNNNSSVNASLSSLSSSFSMLCQSNNNYCSAHW